MEMKHKVIGKWKLTSVNGKRRLERIDSHDIRGVYDAIDFGELYEDEAVIKQQKEMAFLQVLDRDGNLSGSVTIYLNGKPYYTIEELREAMQKIDKNAGNEFKKVCGQVFKAGKLSKRIDVCCSGSVDDYRFYYAEFGENETFFNVISLGSSPFDLIQKEPGSKWQFRDINGNLSDKPTKLGYQLFQAHLDHVSSIIKDKNGSYLTNLRMLDMLELLEFQTKIMDYYAKDIQKTAGYHNSMLDLSDKLILLKQVSLNKYQYDENEKEISELDARFMYAQKRFILKLLNNLPEEDENEAENEDLVNEDKFYAVEDINYNIEKVQKEKNGPWQVRYPHIDLSEEFYFIRPFKYGYAFVEKEQKGHKQFLDLNGMLSEEFYSIGEYFEGYAVVQKKKGGPKQFRDINGNLSDDKYYFTGAYFDGYAKVRQ